MCHNFRQVDRELWMKRQRAQLEETEEEPSEAELEADEVRDEPKPMPVPSD